jgi:uncharacterized SAM-binding protein YcdF (DUF218 family)
MTRLCLLALVAVGGCADLRDTFAPYRPAPAEVAALLAAAPALARYDAAIVLGCPANPDGDPSLCQRCRVKSAVRKYKQGATNKLIMTGAAAHSPEVEAEVMAALAESRGVPKGDVLREPRALTTWQNLRYALALMRQRGWSTALIISTADHLPRARRIARYWGLDDAHTGYVACDRDLPMDDPEVDRLGPRPQDGEAGGRDSGAPSGAQPPTKTKG